MKLRIMLLTFCSLGFMLLLVVALMERSVVILLIKESASVSEQSIRLTFSALKQIVGVLPYTLGLIIVGTFFLAMGQIKQSRGKIWSLLVMVFLLIPMIYNIFIADTAAVVSQLESTEMNHELAKVQMALLDAVKQHYIGLFGFTLSFLIQLKFTLSSCGKTR